MVQSIKDLLRQEEPATEFKPYTYYCADADALSVYFKPDADYSERLADHVTLYRSLESHELVGCRIKGVKGLLEDLPNDLRINHDGIRLSVLFWSFRGGLNEKDREAYKQLASNAGDLVLSQTT